MFKLQIQKCNAGLLCKLDTEKVYYQVHSFLLAENGGERRVMDGIISKVSFSIIFNGSSSGFCQSSKGFSWGTAVLTLQINSIPLTSECKFIEFLRVEAMKVYGLFFVWRGSGYTTVAFKWFLDNCQFKFKQVGHLAQNFCPRTWKLFLLLATWSTLGAYYKFQWLKTSLFERVDQDYQCMDTILSLRKDGGGRRICC